MSVVTQETTEQQEAAATIDFKMVTFSLAGKDYGIDIMKVKEIAKTSEFTYVPNTAPFVRGVHNLRGEIISIIDLRRMFQIEVPPGKEGRVENILILRLSEATIGVVVDSIDRVVGVDSSMIQPPHPLFADINLNYMTGVVEHQDRTYIILDVDRIFGREYERPVTTEPAFTAPARAEQAADVELDFIIETLAAFRQFHVTGLNRGWATRRFESWKADRKERDLDVQLTGEQEADEFLRSFWSPESGRLWSEDSVRNLASILPDKSSGIVKSWNVGCGRGHESYSVACALRLGYPQEQVKVWAVDRDLLSVSVAPNLVLPGGEVPSFYVNEGWVRETASGYTFADSIRDLVVFEYHDILHGNQYPTLDIIVARDVLSFLPSEDQTRVFVEFEGLLRQGGLLMLGRNEEIQREGWRRVEKGNIVAYRKTGS